MTPYSKEEYIKYRLNRAKESLEEALILAENQKWNAVINRLYYACFYASIALLLKNNIEVKSHNGVRTQFSFFFIKTKKIDTKFGKLFSKIFDYRQKGDYGDLYDHDEQTVKPLILKVKEFIKEIEKHFM